jgi:CopG family nickel-responsive transcriptional regulator
MSLIRFGVAIDEQLLGQFDAKINAKGYESRSEAIRDLIRADLLETGERDANAADIVFGTLTLVYDHHVRELSDHLTELQHDLGDQVVSSLHVHLDHHHCLEVIVLRGARGRLREVSDAILATKGVIHGGLVLTGVVDSPGGDHAHSHG